MCDCASTLRVLKEIYVDALYEKKKHYNAVGRKQGYHRRLGVTVIIINILLASTLMGLLKDCNPSVWKSLAALSALVAACASGLQTYFNFQKDAQKHRDIADQFLALTKQCKRVQAYFRDETLSAEELRVRVEELARAYDATIKDAASLPTSEHDYRKAQAGIKDGEEEHTERELGDGSV